MSLAPFVVSKIRVSSRNDGEMSEGTQNSLKWYPLDRVGTTLFYFFSFEVLLACNICKFMVYSVMI